MNTTLLSIMLFMKILLILIILVCLKKFNRLKEFLNFKSEIESRLLSIRTFSQRLYQKLRKTLVIDFMLKTNP